MEGRDHTGVFVACTASADPYRVDEWNRWYVEQHIPDVLGTGIFGATTRFRIAEGFHMPADGTHLQIYETSRPDVPGALADLTTALAGTDDEDRAPSIRSLMSTYTKISEHGNGEGRRANGVVMVFTDCTDPAQEDAFNEWYEFHGGHVLEMMDYYAVTRYRADNPEHWQAKYLAIYETWREDPGTVQREGWEQYFSMSPEERGPDAPAMKLWGEIAFERELYSAVLPADRHAVDCWIGFPTTEPLRMLDPLRAQFKDAESRAETASLVGFLFGSGATRDEDDPVTTTLATMDAHGVELGLVQLITDAAWRAVREHPDRFRGLLHVDPNDTTGAVRAIRDAVAAPGICGVYLFPAGANPQVAVDDPRYSPIYQECVDHDLAVIVNAGVVGPRVPSWSQDVIRFDQVCYDFPDLRIVMCHGAEPDEALAVKLMLKWPGLHFMTSGFAPRHYPRAIVDYANSRGTEKVMYAGYYPYGLTLDRIFTELEDLPLRDHVWPAFLGDNARRVFKLS